MNEYDLGLEYLQSMGILPSNAQVDPNDPYNIGFGSDILSAGVNNVTSPGGFFSSIGDFLSGPGGQALGAGAGALLAKQAYDRLGSIGERARREAGLIGQTGLEQTEFKPFTVATTTGGMLETTPTGGVALDLSPEEQAIQNQLLQGARQFYTQAEQPLGERERAVYERMRSAQRPEEERQRLALEERLAAQGRLGLSSSAYGGATPEQLALAAAEREARDRAMLAAMGQAQAEQMQQAQLGGQLLGAGYIPQAQLLAAAQPAMTTSQLAQRGQLEGAGLFGEAQMSGLEALLSSATAQSNLMGQIGTGLLSQALQPSFVGGGAGGTGGTSGGGLFGSISDLLGITDTNNDGTWWSRLFGG